MTLSQRAQAAANWLQAFAERWEVADCLGPLDSGTQTGGEANTPPIASEDEADNGDRVTG